MGVKYGGRERLFQASQLSREGYDGNIIAASELFKLDVSSDDTLESKLAMRIPRSSLLLRIWVYKTTATALKFYRQDLNKEGIAGAVEIGNAAKALTQGFITPVDVLGGLEDADGKNRIGAVFTQDAHIIAEVDTASLTDVAFTALIALEYINTFS